ncbi:hypothetical protein AWM70_06055 [Paenibacillus yonginensis]|uniref:D,D-heptose 1,7-bisphosphate phosphatase n=1 Tax=Paenibacillus yonginensis TaxID=1462996 RepID=A0A1B1N6Q3_9BACL|nr:hypothetical protein AWM70_06055 [Paenibacillus yonginensis]
MKDSSVQAVFLDRDGTLGGTDHVLLPGQLELFPFVQESIHRLKAAGIWVYSFTNQPLIARGEAVREDFEQELLSFGFDKVYLCPHEHGEGCLCRKPATGMLMQAANENGLDLKQCVVIGDRWKDMVAAYEAGCNRVLVKTGAGQREWDKYQNDEFFGSWKAAVPHFIAEDLNDAVRWVFERS